MELTDNTDFRRRLVTLAELVDVKLSPQRQALYFEALQDIPYAAVVRALDTIAKTWRFLKFPLPAEIRAVAVGTDEDAAERAWLAVRRAIGRVGAYASLAVVDAALGETIQAMFGGWPEACAADLTPEMWASKRKEFGRIYRAMQGRQLVGARYLAGICERQNAGRPDWQRFNPLVLLDGERVRELHGVEAEQYRVQIAAGASGFRQLAESVDALPVRQGDTA